MDIITIQLMIDAMTGCIFLWAYCKREVPLQERIEHNHEEGGQWLDHQKLQNVFFASVGEMFCLFPAGQLIRLLAVVEGPEVCNFLLICYHCSVQFLIVDLVLNGQQLTFSSS